MVLNKKGASPEEISNLEPFRDLRIRILQGETFLLISEVQKDLADYFGKYYKYFMIYFNRGVIKYKTYSELTEEDFNLKLIEIK